MTRGGLAIMLFGGVLLVGGALTLACIYTLDASVVRGVTLSAEQLAAAERTDWYKLLRVIGYAPTWLAIALMLMLVDSGRAHNAAYGQVTGRSMMWTRGPFVLACVAIAGLLAEGTKLITRRARPDVMMPEDVYRFISWAAEGTNTGDLALPSSHAAVAFAGVLALGKLHPRTLSIGLLLAAGCALTRVLAGQHHLSDIVGSLTVALVPVVVLTVLFDRPRFDAAARR